MWNLDECETGSQLLDQFERFVDYWVSPIIGRAIEPAIRFDLDLPPSLIQMLKLNASYSERLFECQHRLLPPSEIRRENDRLYFVDVDCFGHEFAYIHLQGNEDPFVYLEGYDDPVDRLSSYLVSFGLQELMYWAALNDNDAGECWEIPIPELCTAHKIPHVVMREKTNCIHPAHEVTIHLCNHQVLSVESPSSSVRYLSSGTIDAKLKKVIRTRYPGW